jgi:hypothetical protein
VVEPSAWFGNQNLWEASVVVLLWNPSGLLSESFSSWKEFRYCSLLPIHLYRRYLQVP